MGPRQGTNLYFRSRLCDWRRRALYDAVAGLWGRHVNRGQPDPFGLARTRKDPR